MGIAVTPLAKDRHLTMNVLSFLLVSGFSALSFAQKLSNDATVNINQYYSASENRVDLCDGGVCTTKDYCVKGGGTVIHDCKAEFDSPPDYVCCQFATTCGGKVTERVTFVQSPLYPDYDDADRSCSVNIMTGRDVCQVRLDFLDFELPGPDAVGICQQQNNLAIFAPRVPRGILGGGRDSNMLCGVNSGQHVYIPVDEFDDVQLLFTTKFSSIPVDTFAASSPTEYKWNIKVTQIECMSNSRDMRNLESPDGCLQYFTETTGRFKSLNFDGTARIGPNQNYKICFDLMDQTEPPCSVSLRSFTFGLPTGLDSPTNPVAVAGDGTDCSTGESAVAITGALPAGGSPGNTPVLCCTQTLGASLNIEEFDTGRFFFCGTNLGPTGVVLFRAKPFTIGVFTDSWTISRGALATVQPGLAPITATDLGFDLQYTINTGIC